MGCPYSDTALDYWDGVYNPMGDACYNCDEFECEHNANFDNPNWEYCEELCRVDGGHGGAR